MATELNEVLSQSVKIINYIKKQCFKYRTVKSIVRWNGFWSSKSSFPFGSSLVVPRWRSQEAIWTPKGWWAVSNWWEEWPVPYFQDKNWVARLAYLSDIFSYINELNLKLQDQDTTIFNAWNKIESFRKKLKLWLNMIAERNNEIFQSYSDYTMEADDFYSQNSVSDIIAAHLKMLLSLEKYYPEHEDPRRQNMWIVNPFVEHKETAISHEETLQLIELSPDKGLEITFNSVSNSKFWIRMKNEYPNLHKKGQLNFFCFSTTYLCETAFSAITVLKTKQRNRLQLPVSVWLSLQFIPELIS